MASLKVGNVSKRYGSVQALADVSIEFQPARIHAVLGENGAGKSTLMGVLAGFVVPDSGSVVISPSPQRGEGVGGEVVPLPFGRPFACKQLGIEMIHQHFTLVPEFTVEENLALSQLDRLGQPINPGKMAVMAIEIAKGLGWRIEPKAKVRNLPVGVQQRIEILKALSAKGEVIIFDEPTAVLSPAEVDDLFRVIRRLKGENKIVILIAHKLSEVMAVAEFVSVLRRGRLVGEGPMSGFTESRLAELMVGEMPARHEVRGARREELGLEVRNLRVKGDRGEEAVRGVTFEIGRGEILGIGGVDGNGQVELAEALAAVREPTSGEIVWEGGDPNRAYIPQDRQTDGLAMGMSILDNMLITGHRKPELGKGPILSRGRSLQWAHDLMRRFDVRASSPQVPVATLSGGNQQKVVVSRSLETTPDLIVAVNPTRGLDIQATEFVHNTLRMAKENGAAVALFSTDLDELAAVADRTLFMSRGELAKAGGASTLVGGR